MNYAGSSPTTETMGALRLWESSVDRLKRHYTTKIADGDMKTTEHLNDHKMYGEGDELIKHKCVGHIQKRMGNQLRTFK